jgi:hypothetical protein
VADGTDGVLPRGDLLTGADAPIRGIADAEAVSLR